MTYLIVLLTILSTLQGNAEAVKALKVAAFNVQVFGQTKISKSNVLGILAKIVNRYDIILIQEIRSKKDAIRVLLKNVNKLAKSRGSSQYEMSVSGRLGRSANKEQYAFLYRKGIAIARRSYTYADKNDDFEREPYVVHFSIPSGAVNDIVFIGIHTKPKDAVGEIDKLVDVYEDAVKKWNIRNVVIMGDLNAACDYVRDADWKNIRLANDQRFWWLIDDCQDTSLQGSRCAYDRAIASGDDLLKSIVARSAGLYDFKNVYKLSIQEASNVSDHFPVEFEIKQKGWKEVESMDYVLSSVLSKNLKSVLYAELRRSGSQLKSTLFKKTGGKAKIVFKEIKNSIAEAITSVETLKKTYSNLMGDIQTEQAVRYLMRLETNKHPYQVFSEYRNTVDVNIEVELVWDVQKSPITCQLVISKSL